MVKKGVNSTGQKIAAYVMGLVFVLFAALQLNDPDPILWIALYGYAAYCAFGAGIGFANSTHQIVGIFGFGVGFVQLFPPDIANWLQVEQEAKSLKMGLPFIEEARESLGLLIAAVSCLYFYSTTRK